MFRYGLCFRAGLEFYKHGLMINFTLEWISLPIDL